MFGVVEWHCIPSHNKLFWWSHNLLSVFIVSDIWKITNLTGVLDTLTLEGFNLCKTCTSLPHSTYKLQRIWLLIRVTYVHGEIVCFVALWAFSRVLWSRVIFHIHLVVFTCEYNTIISYWSSSIKSMAPSYNFTTSSKS